MKKNMKKVRMLVDTAYQGPRKAGDELMVPEDFANRWVKNGIAVLVSEDSNPKDDEVNGQEQEGDSEGTGEVQDTNEDGPEYDESNYDALTAKELYEICKEQGLDVEPKKSKDYYIGKLEEEAASGAKTDEE